MRRRRKLNIVQKSDQSQANVQSIDSSNEVNRNDESTAFEQQEGSYVESHAFFGSTSESSSKGKYNFGHFNHSSICTLLDICFSNVALFHDIGGKKTRAYTHMLDVWDMSDGEFIRVEVDPLGNPIGWEGKSLLNAIGIVVRRHQCAPINYPSWKDMLQSYINGMLELI